LTYEDDCSLIEEFYSSDDDDSFDGENELSTVSQAVKSLTGLIHTIQIQSWISSKRCVLKSFEKKPIILASSLNDLILGEGKYFIHKQPKIFSDDEVLGIKTTLATLKTQKMLNTIPSGYQAQSTSRYSLSFDRMITENACVDLRWLMAKYCEHMTKLSYRSGLIFQGDSILWDDGSCPHVQLPHTDFYLKNYPSTKNIHRPVSSIHALENFSILLFCFEEGTVGGTIPLRVTVLAGQTIFLAGNLWHSGDYFVTHANLRIHSYLVPPHRSSDGDLYPVQGVNRDDGRKDLFIKSFRVYLSIKGDKKLDHQSMLKYLGWKPVSGTNNGTNNFEYLEKSILQYVSVESQIGHYGYGDSDERSQYLVYVNMLNQIMIERCETLGMTVEVE
jgi:hypothetical protein